jgi:hypothetical protein
MRPLALALTAFTLALLGGARAAHAYEDEFAGWSPDGSWYVDSTSGTDEIPRYRLCISDGDVVPASWPAKMPHPEAGTRCAELCDEFGQDCKADLPQIRKWVVGGSAKAPHGEKVTVKFRKTTALVTVTGKGGLAEAELEMVNDRHPGETTIRWSPSGGAVAVSLFDVRDPRQEDGYGPPSYVAVIPLLPAAVEVRKALGPGAKEVRIGVTSSGTTAWASYETKGQRESAVLARVDGAWQVLTRFASVGLKDQAAHAVAAAGKLPAPPAAPGDEAPAPMAAAFRCDVAVCDDAYVRDDMLITGSAPGEHSVGGAAWTRTWEGWKGRTRLVGAPRGGLAPGGAAGWVVADVAVTYTKGATSYEIPFRLFVVYEHVGDDWVTALAHVSIVKPGAPPAR